MKDKNIGLIVKNNAVFIILIGLIVLLSILDSSFFSFSNLLNILRQCSIYAIMAFGMTFVMISGRIDLSVGAICALSSCASAIFMVEYQMNMWVAVLLAILIGGICGFMNGVFVTIFKVPFFIATAGML